eukprot:TRINITY_DN8478_c0_g1_i1.p1 TRINITY_DN8478_c0_g1~~TRINITY_DN8478_c0_g1_i1.p1  ORF type:complete len:596 (+),score=89.39 TRINITY_DN8478_c0_g1_i1:77-1864(+)
MQETGERITEQSNSLSLSIDVASTLGKVRILRQSDQQLFGGYTSYPSIYEPAVLDHLQAFNDTVTQLVKTSSSKVRVVVTGCGTSGRIGYMVARSFQLLAEHEGYQNRISFHYLHAGDDEALLISNELPEDDANLGITKLIQFTEVEPDTPVAFIGISCGLSAAWVLGQVAYACSNREQYPVVMMVGCNPVNQAPNHTPININFCNKSVTSRMLLLDLISNQGLLMVSLIVGPEAVTGSSRMKGGSIAKIYIETMFSQLLISLKGANQTYSSSIDNLSVYEHTYRKVYLKEESISKLVQLAGNSLLNNGRVYYMGSSSIGIMGFIDASEMFDTYGMSLHTIRGFVKNAWDYNKGVRFNSGNAIRKSDAEDGIFFRISFKDFKNDILPTLSQNDTLIFGIITSIKNNYITEEYNDYLSFAQDIQCKKVLVGLGSEKHQIFRNVSIKVFDFAYEFEVEQDDIYLPLQEEFAWKLICNAITTCACIIKGCVYKNTMLNMGVCNYKLYLRTIEIISNISGCNLEAAENHLLKVIIENDDITDFDLTMNERLEKASHMENVIPQAILIATLNCDLEKARSILKIRPIIRNAIEFAINEPK